jgi:hypothetical protein
VDANPGRSSAAAATNGSVRGTSAFIATEVAVSIQVRSILLENCSYVFLISSLLEPAWRWRDVHVVGGCDGNR